MKEVRRAASQAVAAIGLAEIPARQWTECIDLLGNSAATTTNNPLVREASLMTLGYICEAIEPEALGSQTNTILKVLVKAMSQSEEHVPVRLAAIRALLEAVVFVEGNMLVEQERSAIMAAVCANTQIANVEVRVAAYQVLVEIARLYYVHLPAYMQTLFNLTLKVLLLFFESLFLFFLPKPQCRRLKLMRSLLLSRPLNSGRPSVRWNWSCRGSLTILANRVLQFISLFVDLCDFLLLFCWKHS
jgi:hypothetical protein